MIDYVRSASKATIVGFMSVGCNTIVVAEPAIVLLMTIEVWPVVALKD